VDFAEDPPGVAGQIGGGRLAPLFLCGVLVRQDIHSVLLVEVVRRVPCSSAKVRIESQASASSGALSELSLPARPLCRVLRRVTRLPVERIFPHLI